jgi:hypothetical protein
MWDVVVTHELPLTEAEEACKISASQLCGKILLYPHGLPSGQSRAAELNCYRSLQLISKGGQFQIPAIDVKSRLAKKCFDLLFIPAS